jgi:hypothetical protein
MAATSPVSAKAKMRLDLERAGHLNVKIWRED